MSRRWPKLNASGAPKQERRKEICRATIKFRMEQQGQTRRDLEVLIGTRSRITEVLSRKRALSISMIRRLHEKLGISAEVLIQPTRKGEAA